MTQRGDWRRVSRRRPCPICGKPDWCLYAGDDNNPQPALCQRTESLRRIGEAGWLQKLRDSVTAYPRWRRTIRRAVSLAADEADAACIVKLAAEAAEGTTPILPRCFGEDPLQWLGEDLGLSAESLRRLQVGYSMPHHAWTFPMRNGAGEVVGVRLRKSDGKKLSIKGSKEGLFIPTGLKPCDRLLIGEGPTDTAALLDLGFEAVGRPSCTGGGRLLPELVRRRGLVEWFGVGGEYSIPEAKAKETHSVSGVYGWNSDLAGAGLVEVVQEKRGNAPARWRVAKSPDDAADSLTLLPEGESLKNT